MKQISFIFCISWVALCPLAAQTDVFQSVKINKVPADLPLTYSLWKLALDTREKPGSAAENAESMGLVARAGDGMIRVEIVDKSDSATTIDRAFLEGLGIEIRRTWRNRASAWIHPDNIIPAAQQLKPGYILQAPDRPHHENQGPATMHSASYIANGAGGNGIRIAVIDLGFDLFTEARNAGHISNNTTVINLAGGNFEDPNDSPHGTACLETVFDHAPNAIYFAYKVEDLTDLGAAVEDCIDKDVDIISHSLSWFNTGWADDSGDVCAAVQEASDNGIWFFTSAGNYADGQHAQRDWNDPDGDDWYNWTANNETNTFSVAPNCQVRIDLQGPNSMCDYDLFLVDQNNELIQSSQSGSIVETLTWTNSGAQAATVGIVLRNDGPGNCPFELFVTSSQCQIWLNYSDAENSTTIPSNSTAFNLYSVGAVDYSNYDNPPGSEPIANYSSRGPTNSGSLGVDICAPTFTTTFSAGNFDGTSCATPNAAGATAAFMSAHPNLLNFQIREILLRKATLYHDWGSTGTDNTYGYGGLRLYDFLPNTVYVYQYVSFQPTNIQPYPSPKYANIYAPENSNVIILDQHFTIATPQNPVVLDKKMVYRTALNSSSID